MEQVREAIIAAHDALHTSIHCGQDVASEAISRLTAKLKTPEESVTVIPFPSGGYTVEVDGKQYGQFFGSIKWAETFRQGVIAQRKEDHK